VVAVWRRVEREKQSLELLVKELQAEAQTLDKQLKEANSSLDNVRKQLNEVKKDRAEVFASCSVTAMCCVVCVCD